MSSRIIPEARVFLKVLGYALSSREVKAVVQHIDRDKTITHREPLYPSHAEGDTFTYDFESIKFRVQERGGSIRLTVERDELRQTKEITVGGMFLAEGDDLTGRLFVRSGHLPRKPEAPAEKPRPGFEYGKYNVLSIVDIYGWAWDIASRELFAALPKQYRGCVLTWDDFVAQNVDASRFDVVLVYTFTNSTVMDMLSPANTIVCVAGWEDLEERLVRRPLSRFRYLGACNRKIAEVLRKWYPDAKVLDLSHGVDVDMFKPDPAPHEGFVVGWVGSVERPLKRFWMARAAVAKVAGATLRVAGLVGSQQHMRREQMPAFYHELDCLLVTSRSEAHSLVTYEAMSCACPVVTTMAGDAEENIENNISGMLLPVDCTPDDIAEKLTRLRDDPEYRAYMGGKAREAVLGKWTWGRVANSYVDAFREVRGLPHRSGRRVGFLWWYNPYTTTETSVLTIQRKALEEIGVEVETFNIETVFAREEELKRLNDVDLVFTGVMPLVLEDERFKLVKSPVYFNVDGYGSSTFHDGYFNPQFPKLTEKAALVTFLDMNVAEEFKASGLAFEWDKLFWMPNGAEDLKQEVTNPDEFRKPNETHIGSLMKDNEYKKPWVYLEASTKLGRKARLTYPILNWKAFLHDYGELGWPRGAFGLPSLLEYEDGYVDRSEGGKPFDRSHGDILRVTRARLQGLPDVDFLQHMPYRKVPNYVSGCDVFTHYSHGDAFAKTVTEAFSLGKAPICSDIIRVQGIAEKHLGETRDAIGSPMDGAYGKVKPLLGTGKHLVIVPRGRSDLCAEAIRWALDNRAEYDARGEAARNWSLVWLSWQERWKLIFELAEARKVI